MNNAKLYRESNALQRHDAKNIISEFSHLFNVEKSCNLLDIGTGSGDVLVDILVPILGGKFHEIVGADISTEMVNHAKEKYRSIANYLTFEKLDIESEFLKPECNSKWHAERFDFITSFYCLHWMKNLDQALANIQKLLEPNGVSLMFFVASHPVFEFYLKNSKNEEFAPYMTDVNRYIPPYQLAKDPAKAFSDKLINVNFEILHVEARELRFVYETEESVLNFMISVNPFLNRMPEELQAEFLNTCLTFFGEMDLIDHDENNESRFITPYKLMIAVVKK